MIDYRDFPTASELAAQVDRILGQALVGMPEPTTQEAIDEALKGKVKEWHFTPSFCDGWATSEEDCVRLKAWEPVECMISARGRSGALSFLGVHLKVLFPRCTEAGDCPCKAACREVA